MRNPHFKLAPLALAALLAGGIGAAHAQAAAAPVALAIAAQPLGAALNELARQARLELSFPPALVAGKLAPAVAGQLTPRQALDRLLAGSGLVATLEGSTVLVRAAPAAGAATLSEVRVTANEERETATGPVRGYIAKRSATATKTDTPIIETPQSISVLTQDRISAMGATNVREALAYTPGVVAPTGADSRFDSWINIRGMDSFSPGYYLDGMPLRNNGWYGVWRTENYGTERIEILRGPASVLYGQNPPGGLVNVVSKKPTEEPLHEIQTQLGNHNTRQVAVDFSGPIDEEGQLLYRFVGLARDAQLQFAGMPDDRLYLAPSLTWKPSGATTLTALGYYTNINAGITRRVWPAQGTLVPTPSGQYLPVGNFIDDANFNRQRQKQWGIGYQLEHRPNDVWTLRQNVRFGQLDGNIRQVWHAPSFVTVNPDNANDPANFRQLERVVFASRDKLKSFTMDNQAQARVTLGDWQHTVLVGLDYQRTTVDQLSFYGGDGGVVDAYAPSYTGPFTYPDEPFINTYTGLKQTGLYFQDQIKWNERWVATLGGRYDMARSSLNDRSAGEITRINDNKFSGRAGIVYLAPGGWAPYVSYSESFTPTATIDPVSGSPFKAETGRQYETGVRYQPAGRKDSYSAAIFDLRRRNYISYDGNGVAKQTGEVTVRGLELEALVSPVRRLNMSVAYTWTPKADVTASANASEVGKQLKAVSRNQLSLWTDYRFSNGLKLGMGVRYVGSNRGDEEAAPAKVPAYTLVDALLGYDISRWELALNLRNLTNKTYMANCDATRCWFGDQRRVTATATYRW